MAIVLFLIRCFLSFFKLILIVPSVMKSETEEPIYDYQTDTYLYPEGNREPAFLRFQRYEDRPENTRRS
jgi:hypothetical protein